MKVHPDRKVEDADGRIARSLNATFTVLLGELLLDRLVVHALVVFLIACVLVASVAVEQALSGFGAVALYVSECLLGLAALARAALLLANEVRRFRSAPKRRLRLGRRAP